MRPAAKLARATPARPPSPWPRRGALVGLGLLLFGLGECDEAIYAGLARGWRAALALAGRPDWAAATVGISMYSWPVTLSYRLLCAGLNLVALHVLLRGREARWAGRGYVAVLAACLALLLAGHAAGLPWASQQGRLLLGTACSPVVLLVAYAAARLGPRPPGGPEPFSDPKTMNKEKVEN